MKKMIKGALLALFLCVPWVGLAAATLDFDKEPLLIATLGGKKHYFTVELAVTSEQRSLGLMHRTAMALDRGMLFDFGESRQIMMWMKNTPLPLDMLFIDDRGAIVRIQEKAVPFSESIIDSRSAVKFVLEINGGRAAELGIRPGDRVVSDRIGNGS